MDASIQLTSSFLPVEDPAHDPIQGEFPSLN